MSLFQRWTSLEVEPSVRCNVACGESVALQHQPDAETKTVWDVFRYGLRMSNGNLECFGWRPSDGNHYNFITYNQVEKRALTLAKALRLRAHLAKGSVIGLYSSNSPQWMICALACASSSFVLVPLYDTLGADSSVFIVKETEMSLLFVDTVAKARQIIEGLLAKTVGELKLKTIVLIGSIGHLDGDVEFMPSDLLLGAKKLDISIIGVAEFIEGLPMDDASAFLPQPDTIYMTQYTSGTTGDPKGVVLSHGCFVANIAAIRSMYKLTTKPGGLPRDGAETLLHYLPLAHAYGQLLVLTVLHYGFRIGFFSGNVQNLKDDASILKPDYMPMVPRLMNKVYAKVLEEVNSKGTLTMKVFWFAYRQKRKMLQRGSYTKSSIWDKLVFQKIQAKLGGKVRFMLTASAPVDPKVLEFWRIVFGAHIFEAYGQTECTALVTVAVHPDGGNVGHPVACNLIKLADVAEMDYSTKDRKGEICVKGPNVMKGYFKRPDLTAEAIDADGWLHTGDIGEFLPSGALRIIDRKKNIFKLAQGEYIAPEKIESVYECCSLVAQVFVDGNSLQWFTVAVVVPDAVEAEKWAHQHGVSAFDLASLCKNDDFQQDILASLLAQGRRGGLNRLEQVRSVYLHPEMFTIADGLLTPSMKNRRSRLKNKFAAQLEEMYNNGPMPISQTQSVTNGKGEK